MTTDLSFLLLSSDKRSDDKVEFALDFPAGMGPFICGPGNRSLKAVSRGSGATCTCKYLPYPTLPYTTLILLFYSSFAHDTHIFLCRQVRGR